MAKYLRVTMPDGDWDIPVEVIARNRAENYASDFEGDVERSLKEDTLVLFEESPYEVQDWAANNMNWSDVESVAQKMPTKPRKIDYEEGWMNGSKRIVER